MRKGITLVIVMGLIIVISTLTLVAFSLMTQESRIVRHKIKRTRDLFAAQAAIIQTLEHLRKGEPIDNVIEVGDPSNKGYPISVTMTVGEPLTGTGTIIDGTRPVTATVTH
ncbi:MAG: hypothetical protein PHU64_06570 [Candidatus Omnitrophica bacterium]|nr:hypothetical protein [Candidatus Omnitrophota bacterium]MDD5429800.1 hypothetical protein [Candidatus Omnitrophota bacterium]